MSEYVPQQSCPSKSCGNYAKIGEEYVAVHDLKQKRFRCRECCKTWSAHYKEFHHGLRTEPFKIRRAVDLLNAKIPIRTVARFVKVSPSTVLRWKKKLSNRQ
ncbi:IS1 family transposase [Candidatus Roizmanbacteria bacterium]|nr:IS1 family transposase [Candidatus Roizmanbacteria bacterium]